MRRVELHRPDIIYLALDDRAWSNAEEERCIEDGPAANASDKQERMFKGLLLIETQ